MSTDHPLKDWEFTRYKLVGTGSGANIPLSSSGCTSLPSKGEIEKRNQISSGLTVLSPEVGGAETFQAVAATYRAASVASS